MKRARWLLAAVLLLSLAGAGHWLSGEPAPAQAPSAALPLPLPWPTPASMPGASASGIAAAPPQAQPKATQPVATAPRIGSEGYGAHIERAHAGNDPAAAWAAVKWLGDCATTEHRRHSFEQARNGGVAPEMMTQLMQEADAEARRCQTVTAQHRALLPELALRAMRGGVPEAASVYAGAVQPDALAPALRQEVTAAMRRDALAGHPGSLSGAVVTSEAWGLSETEKLAFLFAHGQMAGTHGPAVAANLVQQRSLRFKVPPTPEQLAAAKLAGQQIVDRAQAKP